MTCATLCPRQRQESLAKLGNMRLNFNKHLLSSTQLSLNDVISARNLPPRENNGAPSELMISTACISSHSSLILTLFTSSLWLDSFSFAFTRKYCGGTMVHDIRCNIMVIYCIPQYYMIVTGIVFRLKQAFSVYLFEMISIVKKSA